MSRIIAVCGDSSSGKTTLSNKLKNCNPSAMILDCDRYHKWERSSSNWMDYTPLNPDSNNITKMITDVISLQDGNCINQVDYNHKTGKFTEPKLIEPAALIIVCGLHSFYCREYVGTFNIYIDTDDELRKEWKIARDTSERGYSEQQVIDAIDRRRSDYEKYILPQRDIADLIIRQYKKDGKVVSETKLRGV